MLHFTTTEGLLNLLMSVCWPQSLKLARASAGNCVVKRCEESGQPLPVFVLQFLRRMCKNEPKGLEQNGHATFSWIKVPYKREDKYPVIYRGIWFAKPS